MISIRIRQFKALVFCGLLVVVLPLAGLVFWGIPVKPYLKFPPQTYLVVHAPFSPDVFAFILGVEVMVVLLCLTMINVKPYKGTERAVYQFPGWGFVALAGVIFFWVMAWTRFSWFEIFQAHTFFPLWLSFILLINAFDVKQNGSCLLYDQPFQFMALFPMSAVFWWGFEFLNRFVNNWYYTGSLYSPLVYFLLATLSFSTVLPAVASIRNYLSSFQVFEHGFSRGPKLCFLDHPGFAWISIGISCMGLFFIGVLPDQLFALVWVSPLFILLGANVLFERQHLFSGIQNGDWSMAVQWSFSALICGFFWEMWNIDSHARWVYSIPYVHGIKLFEMPLLGYAGYLPFGLICAFAAGCVVKIDHIKNPALMKN